MLVEYSDSDEEGAGPAPAPKPPAPVAPQPPAKKQRKEINLQQLLMRNGGVGMPVDDAGKLPPGFFDSAADTAQRFGDADAPQKKGWSGLSAMLPPPKNAPKAASTASALYNRAKPLQAKGSASKATASSSAALSSSETSTAPRAAVPSLAPRLDTSMYAPSFSAGSSSDAYVSQASDVTESLEDYMQPAAYGGGGGGAGGGGADFWASASRNARDSVPSDFDAEKVVNVSLTDLKKTIGPAREFEMGKPKEDVQIAAQFWNRKTGTLEATYKPNRLQKRKHQINALAHDCKEKAAELAQRASMGLKTKQQTQAKYGW